MLTGFVDNILSFIGSLISFAIFLAVVTAGVGFYCYNTLQRLAQFVREAQSNIKVMIQKKAQLVNKLVETAEQIAGHEKVIQLKVSQDVRDSLTGMANAYLQTNFALTQITGLAQKFPSLQGDRGYLQLMDDVRNIESELQTKRELYNGHCREYNAKRMSIPLIFFARALHFSEAPYMDFEEGSKDSIPEFHTDDGALLEKLVAGVGSKVMETSRSLGRQAGEIASTISKKVSTKLYHYADSANKTVGPVSIDELDALLDQGQLTAETWVIEEGSKEWVSLASVSRRVSSSAKPPPPPPPPPPVR